MIRAVLDEVVPADFASALSTDAISVDQFPDAWRSDPHQTLIENAVSAAYDWVIACDKRMPFQQNLSGKSLSILVLSLSACHSC